MPPHYDDDVDYRRVNRRQSSAGLERRASLSGLERRASLTGLSTINRITSATPRDGSNSSGSSSACSRSHPSPARSHPSSMSSPASIKQQHSVLRSTNAVDLATVTKQLKRVQFSDNNGMELESTQRTSTTHHPTPMIAKQVVHNSSARRYAIDEVELYFSEDTKFPASKDDYAVLKFARRNDIIIGGCFDCKETKLGMTRWKTYWAELYNGVLMLHRYKDTVEKKRDLIPIGGCHLRIVDVREGLLDVHYTYQGHREVKSLKFSSKADMFLWWWALQLASVARVDSRLLNHSGRNQTPMSVFELWESSATVENVLFPRAFRQQTPNTRRLSLAIERPSVTHLILVRHGETENIHFRVSDKDKRLTERGREQAAWTAKQIGDQLKKSGVDPENVTLIFGGLRRTVETAMEFERAMPWLRYKHESCLLEDGAPDAIDNMHRQDFRAAMHRMAHEYICRHDPADSQRVHSSKQMESYKILICHTSFVQHLVAQSYQISKDLVKIGAPIGHCSITQVDVVNDSGKQDKMVPVCVNRVQHLPLTHRTSE